MFWIHNWKIAIGPPKINGRSKEWCSYNTLEEYIWLSHEVLSGDHHIELLPLFMAIHFLSLFAVAICCSILGIYSSLLQLEVSCILSKVYTGYLGNGLCFIEKGSNLEFIVSGKKKHR